MQKTWMQSVSVQDVRPNASLFDEAENTGNLRATWQVAIDSGAEWVQLPTWNDYSEGASIAPSLHHGWTFLDVNAYYLTLFKTGKAPTITRDTVYVTHRIQKVSTTPTYPETKLMKVRGGSAARDTVEALTMLTAPGKVEVKVGASTYSCDAPAGIGICTVPLGAGSVAASVVRDGRVVTEVTSSFAVTDTPYVQDLEYYGVSSGRSGTRFVPAATAPAPQATIVKSVIPTADTYANQEASDTNSGTSGSLASTMDSTATSYLRFMIPKTPAGRTLVRAQLQIRTTTLPTAGSTNSHTIRTTSNTWKERELTWASVQPELHAGIGVSLSLKQSTTTTQPRFR